MPIAKRLWVGLAFGLFLSPLGCGSKLASVTGQVVFPDKTPLTSGTVVFNPVDENPYGAQGQIQPDGTFRLGAARPGEGAYPGKYQVHVEPYEDAAGKMVDPRFENARTSGLEYTVVPGSNDFTITIQKANKKKRG